MEEDNQEAHWHQGMMRYCKNHGLTATSREVTRQLEMQKRWDGTWERLIERSRCPHHSPRGQSEGEEKLVKRYGKKYRWDLLRGWQKAGEHGYQRSCEGLL